MRRRTFLGMVGGASAATVLAPYVMRRAHAFGEFPSSASAVQLAKPARRVLEIFLYGGLSQWETLYFVRGRGQANAQQYYTFESANATYATNCGGSDVDRTFAKDADGTDVELGRFAHRLYNSATHATSLSDRMRIVVQRHNLEPHEAAVPQALTGRPVGQPHAAGLGTHIQRALTERMTDHVAPHSYVFATGGISSDNVAAAAATGSHPGSARPLLIKTNNADRLYGLLDRPTVTTAGKHAHDSLVSAYTAQYDKRLEWPKRGRVRAAKVDDFKIAFDTTTRSGDIKSVLPEMPTLGGTACLHTESENIPLMGLEAARHLLTNQNPSARASYVCVSDIGLYEASGGGGYDTHTYNARDTSTNFDNMVQSLLAIINKPGETNPDKLDLDDTLIILNTEFGRTPWSQDGGNGRNHHPYGYVTAYIGGPTVKGISGAIDTAGTATKWATPAQNRIAALLALGIWPFAHEGFAVSDVKDARSELEAAQLSMQACLGRTS